MPNGHHHFYIKKKLIVSKLFDHQVDDQMFNASDLGLWFKILKIFEKKVILNFILQNLNLLILSIK